ncbi:MAG: glycoside hydrolase family 127 protein [Terracidiphilus sp.]|nr:glycoside hydrolase family 127 protein [Terracidiphilus sp.]MDR3775719.1 glycoside hydrolase family 127 protein [Terracidiphilus sp.]
MSLGAVATGAFSYRPLRTLAQAPGATTLPSAAITPGIRSVSYNQVELLEGPMRQQFDTNHKFFLQLDEDRLLKPFRQGAGMKAPGEDMGGWYSFDPAFYGPPNLHGFIPGHSFGQYLSGLARAYAVTGSKPTQEKVQRLVKEFAPTVSSNFYNNYHLPAYTYDKTSCGLIDAYRFAGDGLSLRVHAAVTEAVVPHLPEKALSRAEQYARPHKDEAYCWDETYTLPENLLLAYRLSGNPRYRELAIRFIEDDLYFDPLSRGENVLPGEHAYSHVNAFSSAMQAYLVLGNQKHLQAARNGFDFLRSTQSFVTGGWGPDELFRVPGSGEIGASLTHSHASFETPCGAYGHFKIARYLLAVTGDSRYGDSMESVLYNTILGAKPLKEDGTSFYYSDYNMHASKTYHPDKWPCCSGTFPQITADYGISSYFQDAQGIYVNLYVPSRLSWLQHGANLSLTQQTEYPHAAHTELVLKADRDTTFALRLRIPAWAGGKTVLSINGKHVPADLTPGRFATLSRTWKNGDRIALEFDIPLALQQVDPQHPNLVALQHGSLALFAVNPPAASLTRSNLLSAQQLSTGSLDWEARIGAGKLAFKPFQAIAEEQYRLYQEVIA